MTGELVKRSFMSQWNSFDRSRPSEEEDIEDQLQKIIQGESIQEQMMGGCGTSGQHMNDPFTMNQEHSFFATLMCHNLNTI